jgi:hypothetical protein
VIVMLADADLVVSVTDVALIVTMFPVGTVDGAENTVAAPLGVAGGVKLPHAPLPQETVQVTPAFLLSSLTTAVRSSVKPCTREAGSCSANATDTPAGVVMLIFDVTHFVASLAEVAVMVIVPPLGIEAGATNVVAPPLGVDVGLKPPHSEPPQVTLHRTPEFKVSLRTTTLRLVVVPAAIEAGG